MKKSVYFFSASLLIFSLIFQSCGKHENETNNEVTVEEADKEVVKIEAQEEPVGNDEARETNDDKFDSKEGEKTANYVVNAVEYNYAIIELSKLAIEKSKNKDVIAIAKELKTTHNRHLDELKALAKKEGITIPTQATEKAEKKIDNLGDTDADKFDAKWTNKMISKHEKAISRSEMAVDSENILPAEKQWLNANLPILRKHLEKLKTLDNKLA